MRVEVCSHTGLIVPKAHRKIKCRPVKLIELIGKKTTLYLKCYVTTTPTTIMLPTHAWKSKLFMYLDFDHSFSMQMTFRESVCEDKHVQEHTHTHTHMSAGVK